MRSHKQPAGRDERRKHDTGSGKADKNGATTTLRKHLFAAARVYRSLMICWPALTTARLSARHVAVAGWFQEQPLATRAGQMTKNMSV